jgi:hypothetical protein
MLKNILTAINVGRQLLQARAEFKRDAPAEPELPNTVIPQLAQIDVLSDKVNELELLGQKQAFYIHQLEHDLKEAADHAETVRQKLDKTLWIAVAGLAAALVALAFALLQWLS